MSIDEVIEKMALCAPGGYGFLVTPAALGIDLGREIHGAVGLGLGSGPDPGVSGLCFLGRFNQFLCPSGSSPVKTGSWQ